MCSILAGIAKGLADSTGILKILGYKNLTWTYCSTKSTSFKSSLYGNWMRGRLLFLPKSGGVETTGVRPWLKYWCAIVCTHKAICRCSAVRRTFPAAGTTVFNIAVSSSAISFCRWTKAICFLQKIVASWYCPIPFKNSYLGQVLPHHILIVSKYIINIYCCWSAVRRNAH